MTKGARTGLIASVLLVSLLSCLAAFLWWQGQSSEGGAMSRSIAALDSPATARMDREMAELLVVLDAVRHGDKATGEHCERCEYLAASANVFWEQASTALGDIRRLEASLSIEASDAAPAHHATIRRQLSERQLAAGRAVAGLRSFTDAALACEAEQLCTRDDPSRSIQTSPLDCERDGPTINTALAKITDLADRIIAQARSCQSMSCPVMNCERSAALAADLRVAEISLAELAGGRTSFPGYAQQIPTAGLATVLGGVERALARLAADSTRTSLTPEALAACAHDMREGLAVWLEGKEYRRGVEKESWRVSALMAEIDVAAEWALAGEKVEYTRAYFEALSRAMLSAARLDAALVTGEEERLANRQSAAGPICGTTEIGNAYLSAGQAIAALGFCRAKSACEKGPTSRSFNHSPRSASEGSIAALAAIIGALPLDADRAADASATNAPPASVSLSRDNYLAGEVMTVSADPTPSACLINGGAIGLAAAGTMAVPRQRYHLPPRERSDILLAAPTEPGFYVVRVFASPDRGGQILSEHGFNVAPLGPGCDGFTGLWNTEFGRLRMVERDGQVSGSYRRDKDVPMPGLILGQRDGTRLKGIWLSELGRGGRALRLAEDGAHFRGTWGINVDQTDGAGRWNGECLGR